MHELRTVSCGKLNALFVSCTNLYGRHFEISKATKCGKTSFSFSQQSLRLTKDTVLGESLFANEEFTLTVLLGLLVLARERR